MFMWSLISIVSGSLIIQNVLLSNQKCMTQPPLMNLHPDEYCQEFHYNPLAVRSDRCVGGCNTLNNVSK